MKHTDGHEEELRQERMMMMVNMYGQPTYAEIMQLATLEEVMR